MGGENLFLGFSLGGLRVQPLSSLQAYCDPVGTGYLTQPGILVWRNCFSDIGEEFQLWKLEYARTYRRCYDNITHVSPKKFVSKSSRSKKNEMEL